MSASTTPAFHVSGLSNTKGSIVVPNRKTSPAPGIFHIDMDIHFDPAVDHFPAGTLSIQTYMVNGERSIFIASSIELINSYGKHNPTVYLTGLCKQAAGSSETADGCRYWLMVVKNTKNSSRDLDVIGFCIQDKNGNRIAYGADV